MKPATHHPANNIVMLSLWAAAVCAALLGTNQHVWAATSTNRLPAQGDEDRFLLIVDTSAAMERNAENTQKAVTQLLSTGMVGQARPGDTIGLWTFSNELQTGVFPLQRWTPQTRQKLAAAATNFLAKIRYEKQSRFESVVELLTSVVKDSKRITVIILTDGTGKISGTPFDEPINESYRLNYAGQRKQRMPFLTVLRAQGGEFIGWRVNTPPFRPEFPAFPVDPKTAELKSEPKPPPVPPLIVVGEPPAPTSTPTKVPSAETTVPVAPQKSAPSDSPAQPKPEVQPTSPPLSPVSQIASTTGAPVVVEPAAPRRAESQPSVMPAAATATAAVVPQTTTESPPAVNDTRPPVESKSTEPQTTPTTPQGPPATESPAEATTVQTAVVTPSDSLFNRTNLLIAGAVLLVAAFGLFYLLLRRTARPAERASLITRSMDHDQK